MRIAVIGAGSWGTGFATLVGEANDVALWARRPELAGRLEKTRENEEYLPGHMLGPSVMVTADMAHALRGAELVAIAVPSHGVRAVVELTRGLIEATVPVLSLSKGLEVGTLARMTEVIGEVLQGHEPSRIGVLTGPNLVQELVAGQPAASVIAMTDSVCAGELQLALMGDVLRLYTNSDVIGSEVAGVVKNVIAIGAGIADGMGYGDNTKAALVTRGLAEMTRLGVAVGGDPSTFLGLAGVGDLLATCSSVTSRNRRVGVELGKGRRIADIVTESRMVAEGVRSAEALLAFARRAGVEVPIAEEVGAVLRGERRPGDLVLALMGRAAKPERYGPA